jgi:predicted fused transcriptional regulator/phosphomethylpyrimidine kinase
MSRKEDREIVLGNLVSALHMIEKSRDFALIIPEIRASLAYATPWAKTVKDVAAIEGRIAPVSGYPRAAGLPAFGASLRTAATILVIREYDPEINAAIIVKCNNEIIEILKRYASEKGLIFGMINRQLEPPSDRYKKMGAGWRFRHMADTAGGAPRVFYENKGMGLEQLSILLGKDAVEVTKMALEIAKRYRERIRK